MSLAVLHTLQQLWAWFLACSPALPSFPQLAVSILRIRSHCVATLLECILHLSSHLLSTLPPGRLPIFVATTQLCSMVAFWLHCHSLASRHSWWTTSSIQGSLWLKITLIPPTQLHHNGAASSTGHYVLMSALPFFCIWLQWPILPQQLSLWMRWYLVPTGMFQS